MGGLSAFGGKRGAPTRPVPRRAADDNPGSGRDRPLGFGARSHTASRPTFPIVRARRILCGNQRPGGDVDGPPLMRGAPSTLAELVSPLSEAEFLSLLRRRELAYRPGSNAKRYAPRLGWAGLRRM